MHARMNPPRNAANGNVVPFAYLVAERARRARGLAARGLADWDEDGASAVDLVKEAVFEDILRRILDA